MRPLLADVATRTPMHDARESDAAALNRTFEQGEKLLFFAAAWRSGPGAPRRAQGLQRIWQALRLRTQQLDLLNPELARFIGPQGDCDRLVVVARGQGKDKLAALRRRRQQLRVTRGFDDGPSVGPSVSPCAVPQA